MESEIITLQELYEFKIDQVLPDRTVLGDLRPTGLRPNFVHKFLKRGIELPSSMFAGNGRAPVAEGSKW
jgi:pilus assembly protein CpaF